MLCDDVPSDSDVAIIAATAANPQWVKFYHDNGILTVTMHMRRFVIVGMNHDVESVLSQNGRHFGRITFLRGYCTKPLVSSMKAVSRLTSSSRNSVSLKPLSSSRVGSSL